MPGTFLTLWSIRLAASCFAIVVLLQFVRRSDPSIQVRDGNSTSFLRLIWTVGCFLALLHLVFAFHFYHHWSHAEAVRDTAIRTKSLMGISFGGGVWFNYLFFAVWSADAIWWWYSPTTYYRRGPVIMLAVYGYLGFIAFNGVVVFATGYTRIIGIAYCFLLAACLISNYLRSDSTSGELADHRENSVEDRYDRD